MKRRNVEHRPTVLVLSDFQESKQKLSGTLRQSIAQLVGVHRLDLLILIGEEVQHACFLLKRIGVPRSIAIPLFGFFSRLSSGAIARAYDLAEGARMGRI